MPAKRSWMVRVLRSPWWWCVVVAAVASVAVPVLLSHRPSRLPFRPAATYLRSDKSLWNESTAFGYSGLMFRKVDRTRMEIAPDWGAGFPPKEFPAWYEREAHRPREISERQSEGYCVEAFGWPLPAFWRSIIWMSTGWAQRGAMPGTKPMQVGYLPWPNEVLWRGLLSNFAVYTAMLIAPIWLIGTLRKRRRASRGLCLACGYSRAGLISAAPCPECGAGPPTPAAFTHT